MKIQDVIDHLESIAPPSYQEGYDNAGLIVGNPTNEVQGVLCCLDSVEAVIEEAIEKNCNLVIAHHPIIFRGLKKLTGSNYIERTIIKAIQSNIAIYAIHTNLDNVYAKGVNGRIAETLGLKKMQLLAPKSNLKRMVVKLEAKQAKNLELALKEETLNDVKADWSMDGAWTSISIRFVYSSAKEKAILNAISMATDGVDPNHFSWQIEELDPAVGSGMIGKLPKAMDEIAFLRMVKKKMNTECIRHTAFLEKKIKKVAVCGGSGGFLLANAIRAGADAFLTADYKYHEFFDADGKILIADIGHYESEQYTVDLLQELISQKFSTFAAYCTEVRTNPVQYLV